jgi:cytochrome c553
MTYMTKAQMEKHIRKCAKLYEQQNPTPPKQNDQSQSN